MDLRLRALGRLDPRTVALPHGTEVVTRVDRVNGDRRVPQGTVGRVTRTGDVSLEVTIVGVGTLVYARDELTPRRVGQARFAERRESAWEALTPCVVLDTTVGSRAWGLADEQSDEDKRGVFAHPFAWRAGLVAPPEDLVSADGSVTYWAIDKAIRQALRADPNTLEALFLPSAAVRDEVGAWLLEARDAFVSTEIYGSFGRYAIGQLRRLEQGMRLTEHRTSILAWLRDEPSLSLDGVAARLARVDRRAAPSESDAIHMAKQYVKQLYRSLHDQGLLAANDFASLVRFARDHSADLELPRELRPKNAYNLLRLIATATHWLATGAPEFEMTGPFRERLLSVKRGEVSLGEVLQEADGMIPALEQARDGSPLPERPDVARADTLLRRINAEIARRHIEQRPGPWGTDAPLAPNAEWSE